MNTRSVSDLIDRLKNHPSVFGIGNITRQTSDANKTSSEREVKNSVSIRAHLCRRHMSPCEVRCSRSTWPGHLFRETWFILLPHTCQASCRPSATTSALAGVRRVKINTPRRAVIAPGFVLNRDHVRRDTRTSTGSPATVVVKSCENSASVSRPNLTRLLRYRSERLVAMHAMQRIAAVLLAVAACHTSRGSCDPDRTVFYAIADDADNILIEPTRNADGRCIGKANYTRGMNTTGWVEKTAVHFGTQRVPILFLQMLWRKFSRVSWALP